MSCPLCGDVCRCAAEVPSDRATTQDTSVAPASSLALQSAGSAALRQEIADRVHRYRSRRTYRGPRYPSLRLKFEPAEPSTTRLPGAAAAPSHEVRRQGAATEQSALSRPSVTSPAGARAGEIPNPAKVREALLRDQVAKVIEFPRSNLAPVPLDELAEPVLDRPRILDVPEPTTPPPALGGILLEPVQQQDPQSQPALELPLQSAALHRRMWAAAVDLSVVLAASAVFGALWFRITNLAPSMRSVLITVLTASGFFWAIYHYLFLVYTATTLGLKSAGLQLRTFDGKPPTRPLRRWRVLVSFLSAASAGMGFLWCFLDEDALCWHDRMTRTYLAPQKVSKPDPSPTDSRI
jgi:RDD family